MTGTGIKTNGIGKKTTAHLNLTVSMQHWFGKIIVAHKHPEANISAQPVAHRDRPNSAKVPYAGREAR